MLTYIPYIIPQITSGIHTSPQALTKIDLRMVGKALALQRAGRDIIRMEVWLVERCWWYGLW